jgi:hypothetical protein
VFTPPGAAYFAVGALFVAATGVSMVWALPVISHMVAFQVRGSLNALKRLLPEILRLTAIAATFAVNIPFHTCWPP